MKKIKSLAAVFLALFILAAIPTQAFAAETHEGVATMHTHQWRLDHYDTTYIPIDDVLLPPNWFWPESPPLHFSRR